MKCATCTFALATLSASIVSVSADKASVPVECRRAAAPIQINGKLDEASWEQAQTLCFEMAWMPEGKRQPRTYTKARLLWDDDYLYFAGEMEDSDVFANVTEQDGPLWTNAVFELFFKPSRDKTGYYEFEINAANAKFAMFLPSRGSGGATRHAKERDFHIESKVVVRGTLNDWSDKDKGWTVEGRIPWSDFAPSGGRPAVGDTWLHALCRYDFSVGLEEPALSSSAPLQKLNFHRYEDDVPRRFSGGSSK
jgi:hypothetical protein